MKKVLLITDGSCAGNPGPGGWAAILRFGEKKKELFGYESLTTNNRMELMAVIQGLLAMHERCQVEITTDSEYVLQGATLSLPRWKACHWWRGKFPLRNADLWIELDELLSVHNVSWKWTKGHSNHDDNNRCDWLAQHAARTQSSSWSDKPRSALKYEYGWQYVPPRPQGSLFENAFEHTEEETDDDSISAADLDARLSDTE